MGKKIRARQEIVTLSRTLGRPYQKTKRWARKAIKEHSPLNLEKTFTEYCSLKDKGNKYHFAGCGPSCSSVDERNLLCPTCKLWVWHSECLIVRFQKRKLPVPDFTEKRWKCVHCYGRSQRRTYL